DRPGAPASPPQAESDGRAPRPHAGATRARVAAGAAERDRDPEDFASRSDARERGGAVEAAHEGGSGGTRRAVRAARWADAARDDLSCGWRLRLRWAVRPASGFRRASA